VNAPDFASARALGKAVVNAPLFKCAVAGNDPNVGRLVQAVGKHVGAQAPGTDLSRLRLTLGGVEIFSGGAFRLDPGEGGRARPTCAGRALRERAAQGRRLHAPGRLPAHERCVEIEVDLGHGGRASAVVLGGRPDPRVRERERRLPELAGGPRQRSPAVSSNPYQRFIVWTAWPAVPLTRLSSAEVMMKLPGARVVDRGHVDPVGPDDVRRVRRLPARQDLDERGAGRRPSATRRRATPIVAPGAAGTVIVVAIP
jgi:hypothetical protein